MLFKTVAFIMFIDVKLLFILFYVLFVLFNRCLISILMNQALF